MTGAVDLSASSVRKVALRAAAFGLAYSGLFRSNLARPSHFSEFASRQFAEIPFATVLIQKEEKTYDGPIRSYGSTTI
ncbi:MAG: hypothetical protein DMG34_19150 [Acidobacteria bacterium]|nr:MAG: hypothetical protein DMG34_19150 [Acidobacteriota bacterium]